MGCYIGKSGYYEGDRIDPADCEVPRRPSIFHSWENENWVERIPATRYAELREAAYLAESDPLYFKEQRGDVPIGTWIAKVNEIKARYPK